VSNENSQRIMVRVVYAAEWTETIVVDIPPGTTRREGSRLIGEAAERVKAEPALGPTDITVNDTEILGKPEWSPPDLTVRLPTDDGFWTEWDGSRWCTDGVVLLREGSPLPSAMFREWGDEVWGWRRIGDGAYDIRRGDVLNLLVRAAMGNAEPDPEAEYHERFAPVLDGADVRRGPPGAFASGKPSAAVIRNRRLVAVVMPLAPGHGLPAIYANGERVGAATVSP
jgi:hypothetical protein